MNETIQAEEIYRQLAERDLAYYEQRITELKNPNDRWRMRVHLERVKRLCGSWRLRQMSELPSQNLFPPKIAFEGKHIYIVEDTPKPKTQVWHVFNKSEDDFLGRVFWFAPWRMYAFEAEHKVFAGTCFLEIHAFCDRQTQLLRLRWRHHIP